MEWLVFMAIENVAVGHFRVLKNYSIVQTFNESMSFAKLDRSPQSDSCRGWCGRGLRLCCSPPRGPRWTATSARYYMHIRSNLSPTNTHRSLSLFGNRQTLTGFSFFPPAREAIFFSSGEWFGECNDLRPGFSSFVSATLFSLAWIFVSDRQPVLEN